MPDHARKSTADQPTGRQGTSRRRFAILVVPYLWLVAAIPFIGYAHTRVAGVPVLEVWMLVGVVVCSACLAAATRGRTDPMAEYVRRHAAQEEQT